MQQLQKWYRRLIAFRIDQREKLLRGVEKYGSLQDYIRVLVDKDHI